MHNPVSDSYFLFNLENYERLIPYERLVPITIPLSKKFVFNIFQLASLYFTFCVYPVNCAAYFEFTELVLVLMF